MILAGGQSRRMQGLHQSGPGPIDKAWLPWREHTLIEQVYRRLQPQVATLWVNTPSGEPGSRRGWQTVPDLRDDRPGPLAGFEAGLMRLHALDTEWLLTAPCDAPALPDDLMQRLAAALPLGNGLAAYARAAGRTHPVHCLLHRALAPALGQALDRGDHRVEVWLQAQGAAIADFGDGTAFLNINTPEDWAAGLR